jgi:hypothetical protein
MISASIKYSEGQTMQKNRLIYLVTSLMLLTGCEQSPDQWDAFVYPNANDLTINETIRGFKTFELCQRAAIDRMNAIQKPTGGDYECGFKCKPFGSYGGNICKETRK